MTSSRQLILEARQGTDWEAGTVGENHASMNEFGTLLHPSQVT